MVEEVEGFRLELQSEPLVQMNVPSDAEVKIIDPWPREGVEAFAGDHPEIQLRGIEYRGIGTSASLVQHAREGKVAQETGGRSPAAVDDKPVALVELRVAALGGLVKLVVVARALIDELRKRVANRRKNWLDVCRTETSRPLYVERPVLSTTLIVPKSGL